MAIEFTCTCGARVLGPNDAIGKRAQCNHCGAVLTIPDPEDPRWPPGAKRKENPKRVPDMSSTVVMEVMKPAPVMPPTKSAPPPAPTAAGVPHAPPAPPKHALPQHAAPVAPPAAPVARPIAPPAAPPAPPAAPIAPPIAPVAPPVAPIAQPVRSHAAELPPPSDFVPLPVEDIDSLLEPEDYAPISSPTVIEPAVDRRTVYHKLDVKLAENDEESDDDADPLAGGSAKLTTTEWVLAIVCSGIGTIMGVVYLIQGKRKAGTMLGVSLGAGLLWGVILQMIAQAIRIRTMGP